MQLSITTTPYTLAYRPFATLRLHAEHTIQVTGRHNQARPPGAANIDFSTRTTFVRSLARICPGSGEELGNVESTQAEMRRLMRSAQAAERFIDENG